jgi:hypothetical protein
LLSRVKEESTSLLRALRGEESQLMLVELNLLNCAEGKRGLKGLREVKGILQEGQ